MSRREFWDKQKVSSGIVEPFQSFLGLWRFKPECPTPTFYRDEPNILKN